MRVITVLEWLGFTFKDFPLLLTAGGGRVDDGEIAACAAGPQHTHVQPLPWKLLFAEPDVLCVSPSAL